MSYFVQGTTITLTRGDTFRAKISMTYPDGSNYTPASTDIIRFAMKKTVKDKKPLVLKEIPYDTMVLVIDPDDTKALDFGNYIYDVELTKENGFVSTFITNSKLVLTEEVH